MRAMPSSGLLHSARNASAAAIQKNDREELHELLEQTERQRSPPYLLDAIWTILAESPFCFLRRQSSRRATHARQRLNDGESGYRRHVGNKVAPPIEPRPRRLQNWRPWIFSESDIDQPSLNGSVEIQFNAISKPDPMSALRR